MGWYVIFRDVIFVLLLTMMIGVRNPVGMYTFSICRVHY